MQMDLTGMAGASPSEVLRPAVIPVAGDADLLARVASGDATGVSELYDRHSAAVFGLALRVTRDQGLAEDVVQETFVGVWKHAARFDQTRASARTWIITIAHNRAVDAIRARRANALSLDAENGIAETVPPSPDVWPEVYGRLNLAIVNQALAALPEAQRHSLKLAYFDGLTQNEIATTTGVPLGTVKSRVRLGLLRLRELLAADFEGEFAKNAA